MKKIALIMIASIGTMFLAGCGTQENVDPNANGQLNSFVQCITDKGFKMYGTDRCPHCQKVKKMFGSSFSGVNFINCDPGNTYKSTSVQCDTAGVTGYPTFMFNGTKYEGEKTLQEIADITSCNAALHASGTTTSTGLMNSGVTTTGQ